MWTLVSSVRTVIMDADPIKNLLTTVTNGSLRHEPRSVKQRCEKGRRGGGGEGGIHVSPFSPHPQPPHPPQHPSSPVHISRQITLNQVSEGCVGVCVSVTQCFTCVVRGRVRGEGGGALRGCRAGRHSGSQTLPGTHHAPSHNSLLISPLINLLEHSSTSQLSKVAVV